MKDLRQAICRFVQENYLFGQEITFSDDESFLEQGLVDSTGVLELVTFIETEWGLRVEDEELVPENLDSISSLVRFVGAKTAAADAAGSVSSRGEPTSSRA